MSEMGESSAGSGGTDAPDTDQSPAADDLAASAPDQPVLEMASALAGDSPPPAGVLKPAEAGKASAPASIDAPQAAGAPKPTEPGRATALARDSPLGVLKPAEAGKASAPASIDAPQAAGAPKPTEPGRATALAGDGLPPAASALKPPEPGRADAVEGGGGSGRKKVVIDESAAAWLAQDGSWLAQGDLGQPADEPGSPS